MKRIILLLLMAALLVCFFGCGDLGYANERFYGVIRWSEECNQLVVYIPGIGDVSIPESDSCHASFDGYDESVSESYTLKNGDLVAIDFKYKRGWDNFGVAIMESYPARFDRKASSIEALRENITFAKIENGYELAFPLTDEMPDFAKGDDIYFIYSGGKNGVAYKELIAEGIVTDISDGRINVILSALDSPDTHDPARYFLEKFLSATPEKHPEN